MKKIVSLFCVIALFSLFLSGCGLLAPNAQATPFVYPQTTQAPIPAGGSSGKTYHDISLKVFFLDNVNTRLHAVTVPQQGWFTQSAAELAIEALKTPPTGSGFSAVLPATATVIGVEQSGNTAVANISAPGNAFATQYELFLAHAAIVNTLCELDGIEYATVLFNNQHTGILGFPTGVSGKITGDLSAMFATYESMAQKLALLDPNETDTAVTKARRTITRRALLYFKDIKSDYMLAESRQLELDFANESGTVRRLVEELIKGPSDLVLLSPMFPQETVISQATVARQVDGSCNLDIALQVSNTSFIDLTEAVKTFIANTITATVATFLPGVNAVHLSINEREVVSAVNSQFSATFLRPPAMAHLGDFAVVYMPNSLFTNLLKVTRAVAWQDKRFTGVKLRELVRAPLLREQDIVALFPSDITLEDIAVIGAQNGIVFINISEKLHAFLNGKDLLYSQIVVYSIVNSVTSTHTVGGVQFLVEHSYAQFWGDHINIAQPLMKNNGIIQNY